MLEQVSARLASGFGRPAGDMQDLDTAVDLRSPRELIAFVVGSNAGYPPVLAPSSDDVDALASADGGLTGPIAVLNASATVDNSRTVWGRDHLSFTWTMLAAPAASQRRSIGNAFSEVAYFVPDVPGEF